MFSGPVVLIRFLHLRGLGQVPFSEKKPRRTEHQLRLAIGVASFKKSQLGSFGGWLATVSAVAFPAFGICWAPWEEGRIPKGRAWLSVLITFHVCAWGLLASATSLGLAPQPAWDSLTVLCPLS